MGKVKLVDLSHPFNEKAPLWPAPGFPDVRIDRMGFHARGRVLTQVITTTMHCGTHTDSPAHVASVLEGGKFTDETPLESYYGTGVVVDIPKKKWEIITPKDLENAKPKIEKGDIVIIHTNWHEKYSDSVDYWCYAPGLYKEAAEWLLKKGVKAVGVDLPCVDHPFGTPIGPHRPGPYDPEVLVEYKEETGRDAKEDFPYPLIVHRTLGLNGIMVWESVGGDIDEVVGKRVTIVGFPIRWEKGDGSLVRLVAIVD